MGIRCSIAVSHGAPTRLLTPQWVPDAYEAEVARAGVVPNYRVHWLDEGMVGRPGGVRRPGRPGGLPVLDLLLISSLYGAWGGGPGE